VFNPSTPRLRIYFSPSSQGLVKACVDACVDARQLRQPFQSTASLRCQDVYAAKERLKLNGAA